MSQRKDESREEYLARLRVHNNAYYAAHPERHKQRRAKYYADNRDKRLAAAKLYRIKPEVVAKRRKSKEIKVETIWGRPRPTKCEICSHPSPRKINADHDHRDNSPRLFLCQKCNVLLGHIERDWNRLSMLLAFLYRDKEIHSPHMVSLNFLSKGKYPESPPPTKEARDWIYAHFHGAKLEKKKARWTFKL